MPVTSAAKRKSKRKGRLPALRLSEEAAREMRAEITAAGGVEVCFLADVDENRRIVDPRAVARGNRSAVLPAARDAEEGSVMVHNHPSGLMEPSEADLEVASRLYDQGIGSAIIDNDAKRVRVVVEPPEVSPVVPLVAEELERTLSPDGPLSQWRGYEDRPGQREMLRFVADRYNEKGVGLVEAGTGTGKSLAYLLPAARWAIDNRERTVISTHTITLQEQLVSKDIPQVEDVLGEELSAALVKGRGNYVSIRRAKDALTNAGSLFQQTREEELKMISEWLESTRDGSTADLAQQPSKEVWDQVKSDGDACLRSECPYFHDCFYQKSRRDAASANLIVTNHALFFSDLSLRIQSDNFNGPAALPPYQRVIFDEAHHIEETATRNLSRELPDTALFLLLKALNTQRGVVKSLEFALRAAGQQASAEWLRRRSENSLKPLRARLRKSWQGLFEGIKDWFADRAKRGVDVLRLGAGGAGEPADDPEIDASLDTVLFLLEEISGQFDRIVEHAEETDEERHDDVAARLLDFNIVKRHIDHARRALKACLLPGEGRDSLVRWVRIPSRRAGPRRADGGRRGPSVFLSAAPLAVGPILRENVFQRQKTAVLTSATLAVERDFDFLRRRVGLDRNGEPFSDPLVLEDGGADFSQAVDVRERAVASPFDYESQGLLVIPTDVQYVFGPGGQEKYNQRTAHVISRIVGHSGGGLLGLFASYHALQGVARALRGRHGIRVLVQGERDRSRLLEEFREDGDGVLLGTSSFWEGVDIPGPALRAVVIQKLPFRVPTEPIWAARRDAIEARGGDAFAEHAVPETALKLRQGVGRLIRTRVDRGVVAILDNRLVTKAYGERMRMALPPMRTRSGRWSFLEPLVREFFEDHLN